MRTRTFSTLKKKLFVCIFPLLLALAWALSAQAPTPAFDLVITDGRIIDGTGSPWYSGDRGIRDGKVVAITRTDVSTTPLGRFLFCAGNDGYLRQLLSSRAVLSNGFKNLFL